MKDAVAMYRRIGFREMHRNCTNPIAGALYMGANFVKSSRLLPSIFFLSGVIAERGMLASGPVDWLFWRRSARARSRFLSGLDLRSIPDENGKL